MIIILQSVARARYVREEKKEVRNQMKEMEENKATKKKERRKDRQTDRKDGGRKRNAILSITLYIHKESKKKTWTDEHERKKGIYLIRFPRRNKVILLVRK